MSNVLLLKDDHLRLITPAGAITTIVSLEPEQRGDHPGATTMINYREGSRWLSAFLEMEPGDVHRAVMERDPAPRAWLELPTGTLKSYILRDTIEGLEEIAGPDGGPNVTKVVFADTGTIKHLVTTRPFDELHELINARPAAAAPAGQPSELAGIAAKILNQVTTNTNGPVQRKAPPVPPALQPKRRQNRG